MLTESRTARRHLPEIATAVMVVWLAACVLATVAIPAASRSRAVRLVRSALGASGVERPDSRIPSMAIAADPASRPTPGTTARDGEGGKPPKNEQGKAKKRKSKQRPNKPLVIKGRAIPLVPARVASTEELKAPHHDYPALDILVKRRTKVVAVTAGRVKDTTAGGACGKGVIIRDKHGFTYTYCHGTKRFVSAGKRVKPGEPIMSSGNTGNSSAPHLHLQIQRPNGKLVCPQDLLPKWKKGKPVSPWKASRKGCSN